ncbi:hypothetical protein MOQ72_06190 [Saccharopolyspora sp. K220]|uniref:hypothetical protein n=1 Tax=Saccharopolyspora soli TaxID=2926618 RepID=UPI001F57BE39|nr:hypothetical protein [Saccharopolyspora soli]MCI2417007.1 hypothetical protein [Saccharopolyspora soli]
MTSPQEPEREPFAAPPVSANELSGPGRPNTVDYSFWAGIASVVVGFAMLAAAFLLVSDAELQLVVRETEVQGQRITLEQARGIYLAVVAVMTAIVAVIAGLWIMFLFFMRRGRNWARIVITVAGALWFLLTIPSVVGGSAGDITTALLAVLQLLAVAATVVFAHLAPSNQYFQLARRG